MPYKILNPKKVALMRGLGWGATGGVIGGAFGHNTARDKDLQNQARKLKGEGYTNSQVYYRVRKMRNDPQKAKEWRKSGIKGAAIGAGLGGALGGVTGYRGTKASNKWKASYNARQQARKKDWDDFFYENFYKQYGGYGAGAGRAKPAADTLLKKVQDLGMDTSNIKTKTEFNKAYKTLAKKYHPDINPTAKPDDMKILNATVDDIRKSNWFEKLSFYLDQIRSAGLEKTAKTKA